MHQWRIDLTTTYISNFFYFPPCNCVDISACLSTLRAFGPGLRDRRAPGGGAPRPRGDRPLPGWLAGDTPLLEVS